MPSIFEREFDEAAALEAYKEKLREEAAKQNLSEDLREPARNLSIAFTVVAAVFVALRFAARHRKRAPYGIDDWLMVGALIILIGNFIFNLVMIRYGVGLHSGRLSVAELSRLDEILVGAEIIYVSGVNMYKISILFLYNRIFPVRSIRIGSYICGGLSTAWTLACIFAATFQCTPRAKIWKPYLEGTCIDLFLTQLCISIPSILVDIGILALPIPHIWRLRTTLAQRILISGIFLLGSYVVFTSIYRFVVYLSYRRADVPYTLAMPIAWNVIEISSGIVSGCLPTLAPLVRMVWGSLLPSSSGRSKGPSHGNSGGGGLNTIGGSGPLSGRRSRAWDKMLNTEGGHEDHDGSEPSLVPAKKCGSMNVTVSYDRDRHTDNSSGDEIPLTGIRQETLVEWRVENAGQGQPIGTASSR